MGNVEHGGAAATCEMLADGARWIGDGHFPSAELDEVGAKSLVVLDQG